jgi:hypothetical protein
MPVLCRPQVQLVSLSRSRQNAGAAAFAPVVSNSGAGRQQADGYRSDVVMSGVVDGGQESGPARLTRQAVSRLVVIAFVPAALLVRLFVARPLANLLMVLLAA